MTERLLTPTKITAWLDCAHFLTLKDQVEDGGRQAPESRFGSFAQLLAAKGLDHERDCLADYERQGKSILIIPDRRPGEAFGDWVERVGDPFDLGYDVIYQMPFVHEGVRGIADFLILVRRSRDRGRRLRAGGRQAGQGRGQARPRAPALLLRRRHRSRHGRAPPPHAPLAGLGSGGDARGQRVPGLLAPASGPNWPPCSTPEPATAAPPSPSRATTAASASSSTCAKPSGASEDSLDLRGRHPRPERAALVDAGGPDVGRTWPAQYRPVDGLRPDRLRRLTGQAALQARPVAARRRPPALRHDRTGRRSGLGPGLGQLPAPTAVTCSSTSRATPSGGPTPGSSSCSDSSSSDADGEWRYRTWWAHDLDEEATAAGELIEFLAERRAAHPGMHVYHYNHTERSSLERLAADHGVGEVTLDQLVETGCFVDLCWWPATPCRWAPSPTG